MQICTTQAPATCAGVDTQTRPRPVPPRPLAAPLGCSAQHPGCRVDVGPAPLDLASLAAVRRFAADYKRRYRRPPHCLVNNAGGRSYCRCTAPQLPSLRKGAPKTVPHTLLGLSTLLPIAMEPTGANKVADEGITTAEGVGALVQVNYLGPYALTRLLLEDDQQHLRPSAPARVGVAVAGAGTGPGCGCECRRTAARIHNHIPRTPSCDHVGVQVVTLSSCTHRFGTLGDDVAQFLAGGRGTGGYADTKLANCLFAYELQRRLGDAGIQVLETAVASCCGGTSSHARSGAPSSLGLNTAAHQTPSSHSTISHHHFPMAWGAAELRRGPGRRGKRYLEELALRASAAQVRHAMRAAHTPQRCVMGG